MSLAGPRAAPIRPGIEVDHFRVVRLLARGGMGEVYLARDTKLGRKVALKVIRASSLGNSEAVDRFLFEARTTARFSHPHIVTVFAVGEHQGSPYVALEYLEGQSLRERVTERRLGLKEILRIGIAIGEALQEAHRHGIMRRDLKPDNVLVPQDGRVRVGAVSCSNGSAPGTLGSTVLRAKVARSSSSVRKLWTGRSSSVRLRAALRVARLDRWAGLTIDARAATAPTIIWASHGHLLTG